MKTFRIGILFAAVCLLASCSKIDNDKPGPGPGPGNDGPDMSLSLKWEENFNDSTKLEEHWTKIPRGVSDWNRHMSKYGGLYDIKNGNLVLRGIKNTMFPDDLRSVLTGGVSTINKKSFGFGRIEVKAKLSGADSAWPAIWLAYPPWPSGGEDEMIERSEIVIMERLNREERVYQSIHSSYTNESDKNKNNPKSSVSVSVNPNEYNVYAVELYPDEIKLFVNSIHTLTYPRIKPNKSGQFPFADNEYFLMMSMHLGGDGVGPIKTTNLPTEMQIDWVRYFQKK